MKLVKESINILKPKDPKKIVEELIDKGSIMDKYAIVVELFSEDWAKLHDESYKELRFSYCLSTELEKIMIVGV